MSFDIYNKQLLRLAASVPHIGSLDQPDISVTEHNRLCGSWIAVDLKLDQGVIVAFAQRMEACLIGQAAASIVGRTILGLTRADIHAGADALRLLLRERQVPACEPWSALEPLLPVAEVPGRHGSALLPFHALEQALLAVEADDGVISAPDP